MKTKGPYLPQTRRLAHKKPPFIPQQRDSQILEAVYDNRFLTLAMLAQLFPPDRDRTPEHRKTDNPKHPHTNLGRRLGKLFHHHHLDRLRLTYGGELIYALGQAGAELLRTKQLRLFSDSIDWDEKNRKLSHPNIDHALMVARFRVALTVALRSLSPLTLASFQREGKDLKAEWKNHGRRVYVYPDAFFVLRYTDRPTGKNRLPCFLEADQSTMAHTRMVEKFERYADLAGQAALLQDRFDASTFSVLTITKTAARAQNLLATLRNARGVPESLQKRFFFISETEYAEHLENIFAAVWYAGNNPNTPQPFHHLPPLPKK